MLALLFAAAVPCTLVIWVILFWKPHGRPSPLVSPEKANSETYPYVFVDNDGSVRELNQEERKYLETPFSGSDGARPYVKFNYRSRDGWGELKGFCRRSAIPKGMPIRSATPI